MTNTTRASQYRRPPLVPGAPPGDIIQTILDLEKQMKSVMVQNPGMQDPWHYVGDANTGLGTTFGTGWANRGGGWMNLAFRLISPNLVEVRGGITVGTAGTVVFTLPVGYQPVSTQALNYYVVAGSGATQTNAPLLNVAATTGTVQQNGVSTGGATAAWVAGTISLDG